MVETDEGNINGMMLWCGGDEVFTVEQSVSTSTLTLQRSSQCRSCSKSSLSCSKSPSPTGRKISVSLIGT